MTKIQVEIALIQSMKLDLSSQKIVIVIVREEYQRLLSEMS